MAKFLFRILGGLLNIKGRWAWSIRQVLFTQVHVCNQELLLDQEMKSNSLFCIQQARDPETRMRN